MLPSAGLDDDKGGTRELIVDVDDALVKAKDKRISREDVATLCVECLALPEAENMSFDVVAKGEEGNATNDFAALLKSLGGRSCDYSLNDQMREKVLT